MKLEAWISGTCVTAILVPSALLFLEYAVLDVMATTWFL